MPVNLLTSPKSAALLLAMLFAAPVASGGNAADLAIPIKATPRHEQRPPAKSREQLFKEFLDWKRTQQQR